MKRCAIFALAIILVACEQAPSAFVPAPLAFEQNLAAPTGIKVGEIRIIDHYRSPLHRPNIEQEFPLPPALAVRKWVDARLKATGSSGVLEVNIDKASAIATPLPKTKGLKGLITDDQDTRVDATLVVVFKLYTGAQAISDASGTVEIRRSRTINERATVYEREAIYHQMTNEMMVDFEREANARFSQYFKTFVN